MPLVENKIEQFFSLKKYGEGLTARIAQRQLNNAGVNIIFWTHLPAATISNRDRCFRCTRPTLVLARQVEFLRLVVWTVLTILCLPRFLLFLIYACGFFWHAAGDA